MTMTSKQKSIIQEAIGALENNARWAHMAWSNAPVSSNRHDNAKGSESMAQEAILRLRELLNDSGIESTEWDPSMSFDSHIEEDNLRMEVEDLTNERDELRAEVERLKKKANRWRDVANKTGLILKRVTNREGPDYQEAIALTFDDGPEVLDNTDSPTQ